LHFKGYLFLNLRGATLTASGRKIGPPQST